MVNMNFMSQSASDTRRKLQRLDGAMGMNPSQLADIAYNEGWGRRRLLCGHRDTAVRSCGPTAARLLPREPRRPPTRAASKPPKRLLTAPEARLCCSTAMAQTLSSRRCWQCELSVLPAQSPPQPPRVPPPVSPAGPIVGVADRYDAMTTRADTQWELLCVVTWQRRFSVYFAFWEITAVRSPHNASKITRHRQTHWAQKLVQRPIIIIIIIIIIITSSSSSFFIPGRNQQSNTACSSCLRLLLILAPLHLPLMLSRLPVAPLWSLGCGGQP
ncbi:hypothetical protein QTO34_004785 [Cnephaeus nilssonii]|uniref:Uncharacterized protein n=1 Tax=Cnephaeus nilssonii TaxID=3371016 RepID=A0AA40HPV1_CNENI|nr:hypothetical protein QTO34_004785 [Eptesicus nilssonii]